MLTWFVDVTWPSHVIVNYIIRLFIGSVQVQMSLNRFRNSSKEENLEPNFKFSSRLNSKPELNLSSILTGSGSNLSSELDLPITTKKMEMSVELLSISVLYI